MPREVREVAAVKLFAGRTLVPVQRRCLLRERYCLPTRKNQIPGRAPSPPGRLTFRQPRSPLGRCGSILKPGRGGRGQHGLRKRGHGAQGVGEGRTGRARGSSPASRESPTLAGRGYAERARARSRASLAGKGSPACACFGRDRHPLGLASSSLFCLCPFWPSGRGVAC